MVTIFFAGVVACKKDQPVPVKTFPAGGYGFACQDTALDWKPFKPDPFGLVYHYTMSNGNRGIWRVAYDPFDPDVLYYITLENTTGKCIYRYNRRTRVRTLLDQNVLDDFSVSHTGLIAYEKVDFNIYVMTTNGDSIHAVTSGNRFLYPVWSADGKSLLICDQQQPPSLPKEIIVDKNGTLLQSLNWLENRNVYHITNFVYYFSFNTTNEIYRRDLVTGIDKLITNDNTDLRTLFVNSSNMVLYYTTQNGGLFSVNLATLEKVKLVSSGYGSHSYLNHFVLSGLTGRFAAVQTTDNLSLPDTSTINEQGDIIEFSPDGKCRQKLVLP